MRKLLCLGFIFALGFSCTVKEEQISKICKEAKFALDTASMVHEMFCEKHFDAEKCQIAELALDVARIRYEQECN